LERDEYYENAAASSSQAADITEVFNERTEEGDTGTGSDNEVVD
ncbi:15482_t:CDS:1, partial [Cetraspora pellucida]